MTGALAGSLVPLVTPFRDGEVDYDTYTQLVERQGRDGGDGVVVTGTTGEPSVLTVAERVELTRVAVATADGRFPVVAATGAASLAETLVLSIAATQAGADALLVVTPYYSRPPQRGLVAYFQEVCRNTSLPVLIYHIPGRAAVGITVESVVEVAEACPNLVGMKHASSDVGYLNALLHALPDFKVFAGLEELSYPMLTMGAVGVMNAVGNLVPGAPAALCQAVVSGDVARARALDRELSELAQAVFWDINPIPVKYLMWRLALLPTDEHRLPLTPPDPELAARLDDLIARSPLLEKLISR